MYDVAIIGCGIVGASLAFELSKYKLSICVLEKENDVACGATKANSAVLHAGYDPKPGTLMAKFNAAGNFLSQELCKALDVPIKQTGSHVIAYTPQEMDVLKKLYERGIQNGVEGLRLLDKKALHEMEPNVADETLGSLYAPSACVISPWEFCLALAQTALKNGVEFFLNTEVNDITQNDGFYTLQASRKSILAHFVVNAAGINSDKIYRLLYKTRTVPDAFEISPSKGQYFVLDKSQCSLVNSILFKCPTPLGKGVLVLPTVHGNLMLGPSTEPDSPAEDVSTSAPTLDSIAEITKKMVNGINPRECIRTFAGLRAVSDEDDFIIRESCIYKGFILAAGIKSPGLTCAAAIAPYIAGLLSKCGLSLIKKQEYIKTRKVIRIKHTNLSTRNELIRENPRYGNIICRCEGITEGEIADALQDPLCPSSLDAVKRRCGAGLGRCQGGFCGSRIHELIVKERKVSSADVLLDANGSYITLD